MKKIFLFVSVMLAASCTVKAQELKLTSDNVSKIVKAMTLEEKVAVIVGKGSGAFDGRGRSYDYVAGSAGATNPIDRLGIPPIVYADGPSGLRIDNKQCTRFPNGLLNAASWNSDMLERMGEAYGNEAKARGVDVVLGPGMNIQRNPLCGRNFEYFALRPYVGCPGAWHTEGWGGGVPQAFRCQQSRTQPTEQRQPSQQASPP